MLKRLLIDEIFNKKNPKMQIVFLVHLRCAFFNFSRCSEKWNAIKDMPCQAKGLGGEKYKKLHFRNYEREIAPIFEAESIIAVLDEYVSFSASKSRDEFWKDTQLPLQGRDRKYHFFCISILLVLPYSYQQPLFHIEVITKYIIIQIKIQFWN